MSNVVSAKEFWRRKMLQLEAKQRAGLDGPVRSKVVRRPVLIRKRIEAMMRKEKPK